MNEEKPQIRNFPRKCSQINNMNSIKKEKSLPPSLTCSAPTHTRLDTGPGQKSLRGQTKPSFISLHHDCSTLLLLWLSTSLQQYSCARGSKRGPQMSVHSGPAAVVEGGGEQRSSRIGQTKVLREVVVVRGGEGGLKLLLPAGNKYLDNSVLTSNMSYITLSRTRQRKAKWRNTVGKIRQKPLEEENNSWEVQERCTGIHWLSF